MAIHRSASGDIQQLVADLSAEGADADVRREAAIARLRVIGARALRHLIALVGPGTPRLTRAAAFRALEGRGDTLLVEPTLTALSDPDPELRIAALGVVRALIDGPRGTHVLDRVTALVLDPAEQIPVRQAGITAIADLPDRTLRPLIERLEQDPDPVIRATVEHRHLVPLSDPALTLENAAAGRLRADPHYLRRMISEAGPQVPLPILHRLVGVIGERERLESRPARRRDWLTVRGAVHDVLARRDSRVALYDLREAFEGSAEPLPEAFTAAATLIGDASCLEAIAAAFARAPKTGAALEWRVGLITAAREIVRRERLTRRHTTLKRIHGKWGEAVAGLLG